MSNPDNENRETGASFLSRITLDKFIEPAAIITIVVAATYYVGQAYINTYYGRLGLDTTSLEFPTSFYIQQSVIPVLIGVIATYLSFSLSGKPRPRSNRISAFWGNILIFLAGLLILYIGLQEFGNGKVFYTSIAVIVLIATAVLTFLKISFADTIKTSFLFRLGALIAIFALFVLTAQVLGNNQAVVLINGNYKEALNVRFNWKDTKNEPVPQELGDDLILLMQYKGNYYVVKKQALQSKQVQVFPEIYMVPEGNIKFAVIRREIR